MAVRRLVFEGPAAPEAQEGGVEFLWDDCSTLRVDAVKHRLRLTDRPWRDPFESSDVPIPLAEIDRVGRWVRRDVSRRRPFDLVIGHVLTKATETEGEVTLHFGGTTVGVSLPGVDPVVSVTYTAETGEYPGML